MAFTIGYQSSSITNTATTAQNGNSTTQGTITCVGNLSAPNIYKKTEVDNKLTLKLDSTALTDYYTKSYVDTALGGKQPLLNMLTALSGDTITVAGAIAAAGFTTTGTANFGSINAAIFKYQP